MKINLKKNANYTFTKHLLNSALALVAVLLPMYWYDFIGLDNLILITSVTIAYYPMHSNIHKDRQIVES